MSDVRQPERPEPAPRLPPLADKADDLDAVRAAMVEAAGVSSGLWISYLFVLFYLLVAAGAVTHRDLFFENPVKLPFLGVDLPLKAFFWLGPALFLIVHAYVLLHFVLLAGKIGTFDAQLRAQVADLELRTRLRRQLPSNIFVQFLAGPVEVRRGLVGLLLEVIAWISLVIGPVLLLVFFQLQFLPYHEEWITWWQRIAVLSDVALLWALWPAVVRQTAPDKSAAAWSAWWRRRTAAFGSGMERLPGPLHSASQSSRGVARFNLRWSTVLVLGCVTVVSLPLVFAIATFPGEWLEARLQSLGQVPLHQTLVEGGVNFGNGQRESWWSNTLVLPGLDVIDHSKLDSEEKIAAIRETAWLRGRNLQGAVLIGAILRKVDFSAANLSGAQLQRADLRSAKLECVQVLSTEQSEAMGRRTAALVCAQLKGAWLNSAQLQGASLEGAQLQGAHLNHAHLQGVALDLAKLQGADLENAQLQGAALSGAALQGADLNGTQLQAAALDRAQLQGAELDGAQLQGAVLAYAGIEGATLYGAQLQGADLRGARLQGARLDRAELQGAALDGALLQGASLDRVLLWRTTIKYARTSNTRVLMGDLTETGGCARPEEQTCSWSLTQFLDLKKIITTGVPEGPARDKALRLIDLRLDPSKTMDDEYETAGQWAKLRQSPPTQADYQGELAGAFRSIGCRADGAPYILARLIREIGGRIEASSELSRLGAYFLSGNCAGARGLSGIDLRKLWAFRNGYIERGPKG